MNEAIEPCPECETPCRVERHKFHAHYVPLPTSIDAERLANAYNNVSFRTGEGHGLSMDLWRLVAIEYAEVSADRDQIVSAETPE